MSLAERLQMGHLCRQAGSASCGRTLLLQHGQPLHTKLFCQHQPVQTPQAAARLEPCCPRSAEPRRQPGSTALLRSRLCCSMLLPGRARWQACQGCTIIAVCGAHPETQQPE